MSRIIPVREAAIAKANSLMAEGDVTGANEAINKGLKEVGDIIHDEIIKYIVNEAAIKPMMEMLGTKVCA